MLKKAQAKRAFALTPKELASLPWQILLEEGGVDKQTILWREDLIASTERRREATRVRSIEPFDMTGDYDVAGFFTRAWGASETNYLIFEIGGEW